MKTQFFIANFLRFLSLDFEVWNPAVNYCCLYILRSVRFLFFYFSVAFFISCSPLSYSHLLSYIHIYVHVFNLPCDLKYFFGLVQILCFVKIFKFSWHLEVCYGKYIKTQNKIQYKHYYHYFFFFFDTASEYKFMHFLFTFSSGRHNEIHTLILYKILNYLIQFFKKF